MDVEFWPLNKFAVKSTAANAHKLSSVGTVAISFDQRITEEAFFIFLFAQCGLLESGCGLSSNDVSVWL